jgi:hypothetical protein
MAGDYDNNHRYLIEKKWAGEAISLSLSIDKHQDTGVCYPEV